MSKTVSKIALTASLALAMVFTFSCSSDGGGGGNPHSGGEPSSSSDEPKSSSSEAESSSSVPPSSSSVEPSSSSVPSSSSLAYSGRGNDISNYRTVRIGDQTWMAENLDYVVGDSRCHGDDPANCVTYGSLYYWPTAMVLPFDCFAITCSNQIQQPHQGICPSGWHIPSREDWGKLSRYVDGTSGTFAGYFSTTASKNLKSTSGWNNNGNGTDEFGFSALPGGDGRSNGYDINVGYAGNWWSADEYSNVYAYFQGIYGEDEYSNMFLRGSKGSDMFSVRCVQD